MSVATECVPVVELPERYVPSESVPRARSDRERGLRVVSGGSVRHGVRSLGPAAELAGRPYPVRTAHSAPTARPAQVTPRLFDAGGRSAVALLVEGPVAPTRFSRVSRVARPSPVRHGTENRSVLVAADTVRSRADHGSLRVTRRGRAVLAVVGGVGAAVFVLLAWLSAPQGAGAADGASGVRGAVPAAVTVRSGDTLWSLAQQYDPGRDPGAVVFSLMHLNHLHSAQVMPGQVIRLR